MSGIDSDANVNRYSSYDEGSSFIIKVVRKQCPTGDDTGQTTRLEIPMVAGIIQSEVGISCSCFALLNSIEIECCSVQSLDLQPNYR